MSSSAFVSILTFLGCLLAYLLFVLRRNSAVLKVCLYFIDNHWDDGYRKLPSQYQMIFQPRYYHLWTVSQWERWAGVSGASGFKQQAREA